MNRIILIGNGFDLAHGLKSRYKNFVDDFWDNIIAQLNKSPNSKPFDDNENILHVEKRSGTWSPGNNYKELINYLKRDNIRYEIKNEFLKIISEKNSLQNWVDVENEYYRLLNKSINLPPIRGSYTIEVLNRDFKEVKNLLRKYLERVVEEGNIQMNTTILSQIYSSFILKDFSEVSLEEETEIELQKISKKQEELENGLISERDLTEQEKRLLDEKNIDHDLIKRLLQYNTAINYFDLLPDEVLFLNFNYTATESLYAKVSKSSGFWNSDIGKIDKQTIHIHGELKNDRNPVIFGFGDELDEKYKAIEDLNKNEYLKNIKSINYLQTDNYKRLLKFIESDIFQVFVYGHSCGLSDRTLLNTMFEHDNCGSIKVFYHKKEDGSDNFTDVVQNISRNFTDKAKFRDRVVNKTYCGALGE